ncbi:MAG TPA: S8 family serine peptidase [Solirubrobacteraceae bacterium]|nr:S8 family serine peptidase [Solirubrobacteraceae bacterium]
MRRLVLLAVTGLLAVAPTARAAPDPLRPQQWGLDMIAADPAHQVATGAGAVVAVIDSGVQADHPDLAGRLLPGHDFVDNDETPQDGNGHGTHVTGIVAADAGNGIGVEGVAPGAMVLPVRVLGDDGSGSTDAVIQGIDYAVARHVDVINLSLGSDVPLVGGTPPEFDQAIHRALDAGIVVVAAAGNSSLPACDQPSGEGRLLCVGAVDRNGNRAVYSNFGRGLGISAPGGSGLPLDHDILSTVPPSTYAEMAGTSQATPHVAAVAALLAGLGLHGQAAVQRILATARDVGSPGPDSTYGAGIVDARAAVAGLRAGGGGSTGAPRSGAGSAARVRIAAVQRIAYVLRHGLRVTCIAAGRGRCRVRVRLGRRVVGAASRAVRAGRPVIVTARLNRAARRALRNARRARLRVRVALPGAPAVDRTVTLVR